MPAHKHRKANAEDEPLPRKAKREMPLKADRRSKRLKKNADTSDGNAVPEFLPIPEDTASSETQNNDHDAPVRHDRSVMSGKQQRKSSEQTAKPELSNRQKRNAARREERDQKKLKRQRAEAAQDAESVANNGVDNGEARQPERKKMKKGTAQTTSASAERKEQDLRGGKSDNDTKKPGKTSKALNPNAEPIISNRHNTAEDTQPKKTADGSKPGKSQRFIAFIGNLPYSATSETITQHFSAIAPFSVRAPTDPKTGKPKGYAFLEFEGYDKMKSCLKLYHHSTFGEGKNARKINVELTAGGGGKGENRKAKIKEKNDKLKEERKRTHEGEAKARRKGVKENGESQVDAVAEQDEDEHAGVHPSRRRRMGL